MPVGTGLIARFHFADACASLWLDGELVEVEELFLDDAARDIRSPSHQLTIARDVLQTRRRIVTQEPKWALSPNGLVSLRQTEQMWPAPPLDGGIIADKESSAVHDSAIDGGIGTGRGRKIVGMTGSICRASNSVSKSTIGCCWSGLWFRLA